MEDANKIGQAEAPKRTRVESPTTQALRRMHKAHVALTNAQVKASTLAAGIAGAEDALKAAGTEVDAAQANLDRVVAEAKRAATAVK